MIQLDKLTSCLALGTTADKRFFKNPNINKNIHTYLNHQSVVIEVGGNVGDDSALYVELYNPFIIIFEPIPSLCKQLTDRFRTNTKAETHCFGIGDRNKTLPIELTGTHGEGSSMMKKSSPTSNSSFVLQVVILEAVHVIRHTLNKRQTKVIDLLSINCEGCEYEVILSLIQSNTIVLLQNLQFQTHYGLLKHDTYYYCIIQQLLNVTHTITYQYHGLWESWRLRDS
jgi:FkbM family methyltransferase